MRRTCLWLWVVIGLMPTLRCDDAARLASRKSIEPVPVDTATPAALASIGYIAPAGEAKATVMPPASTDRHVIRTAALALDVASVEEALDRAAILAQQAGGFVAARQLSGPPERRAGSISLRVPPPHFQSVLVELRTLGQVTSAVESADDQTHAYRDLETRLRVKHEAEQRVREIIRTHTADLSDLLEAEREASRLREEIEQLQAEFDALRAKVDLTTIDVSVATRVPLMQMSALAPISEAVHLALETLARSIGALLLLIVAAIPWVLGILLLLLGWRHRARLSWR